MNHILSKFEKKDICVICNKISEENKNDNINARFYYVECAGQLCASCYNKIYTQKTT